MVRILPRSAPLALLLLCTAVHAGAEFLVTGQSRPGAATFTAENAATAELRVGDRVGTGRITVRSEGQLMLFEPSGAVVVLLGDTTLEVRPEPMRGEILLELHAGRVMTISDRPPNATPALVLVLALGDDEAAYAYVPVIPGQVYGAVDEAGGRIGFTVLGDTAELSIEYGDGVVTLVDGQRAELRAGQAATVSELGLLPLELGFTAAFGRELGVESARYSRGAVEVNLFNNIILWDRFAESRYVTARIQEPPFNPEIRQTVQSVSLPARTTARVERPTTVPFPAANEVPFLSPAAASVQNVRNVGQGVTAIELNRNAANLLIATGSRGLGFGGLRQLTIPGFTGGTRTPAPAGLGAERTQLTSPR